MTNNSKKRETVVVFILLFILVVAAELIFLYHKREDELRSFFYGGDLKLCSAVFLEEEGEERRFEVTILNEGKSDEGVPEIFLVSEENPYGYQLNCADEHVMEIWNRHYIPSGETVTSTYELDRSDYHYDEEAIDQLLKGEAKIAIRHSIYPDECKIEKIDNENE